MASFLSALTVLFFFFSPSASWCLISAFLHQTHGYTSSAEHLHCIAGGRIQTHPQCIIWHVVLVCGGLGRRSSAESSRGRQAGGSGGDRLISNVWLGKNRFRSDPVKIKEDVGAEIFDFKNGQIHKYRCNRLFSMITLCRVCNRTRKKNPRDFFLLSKHKKKGFGER